MNEWMTNERIVEGAPLWTTVAYLVWYLVLGTIQRSMNMRKQLGTHPSTVPLVPWSTIRYYFMGLSSNDFMDPPRMHLVKK